MDLHPRLPRGTSKDTFPIRDLRGEGRFKPCAWFSVRKSGAVEDSLEFHGSDEALDSLDGVSHFFPCHLNGGPEFRPPISLHAATATSAILLEDHRSGSGRDRRLGAEREDEFLAQIEPAPLLRITLLHALGKECPGVSEILKAVWVVVRHPDCGQGLSGNRREVNINLAGGRIPCVLNELVEDELLTLTLKEFGEPLPVDREPIRCGILRRNLHRSTSPAYTRS